MTLRKLLSFEKLLYFIDHENDVSHLLNFL